MTPFSHIATDLLYVGIVSSDVETLLALFVTRSGHDLTQDWDIEPCSLEFAPWSLSIALPEEQVETDSQDLAPLSSDVALFFRDFAMLLADFATLSSHVATGSGEIGPALRRLVTRSVSWSRRAAALRRDHQEQRASATLAHGHPGLLSALGRKAFSVQPLYAEGDEKAFWAQKSPLERLEALEQMRQILYGYDPA